jgi:hypothetical protein
MVISSQGAKQLFFPNKFLIKFGPFQRARSIHLIFLVIFDAAKSA